MTGLTTADRVVALLEWGDVAEADAAVEAVDPNGPEAWQALLWRGARALMEGRFSACERLAADAARRGQEAGEPRASLLATLLLVGLRREQQRPAEAEILLRGLLEEHPSAPAGAHAVLAAVLGEMGRDAQAHQELVQLLPTDPVPATGRLGALFQLAELASEVEATEEAELLSRRLAPHAGDFAVEDGGAVFYGSVSLALGRLAQTLGHWDEAVAHFDHALEAHSRAGAPLLLAHTQRHLAALLRTRGHPGDWERGVDLLDAAAGIYRQLGVDRLAAETQVVLARSEDGTGRSLGDLGDGPLWFRRQDDGWLVGPPDEAVRLRDGRGLGDIARLLHAPGRELHVFDLLEARAAARPGPVSGRARAWPTAGFRVWPLAVAVLDETTRAEYEARLADLASELVEAERAGDRIRAALARAERDALTSVLAEGETGDPLERACRVVATRIRIAVDRIERAHPELGHHLRRSVRTGTFCAYEPTRTVHWAL
ncbi:MAG: hypothetical protein M3314_11655 [Actinomycetota bacterium]|nr:hypothetical protein [Actinomycetota bacterium]